jgi:DNA repair exonuclease SbcCD ATPase subunit
MSHEIDKIADELEKIGVLRIQIPEQRESLSEVESKVEKLKRQKREQNRRWRQIQKQKQEKLLETYGGIPLFDPISGEFIGTRQKWERSEQLESKEETIGSLSIEDKMKMRASILLKIKKLEAQIALIDEIENVENEISQEDWENFQRAEALKV